ncbi:MAG: carbohydrate kinase family protein [Chloroflexota bacterium]|nr:carbohydrate kinase family protein [Chloroflexota bacterium]
MTKTYDIIAFADTCVDLILRDDDVAPRFGQVEKTVAEYDLVMGGSCCIFATQAAKLGLKVVLLGTVGDDAFGELILDTLSSAGVDTRYMQVDKDLRTGLTVHLTQGDDRAMLTYPGSSKALTAADIPDDMLSQSRHLHYGSLFLQTGLLPDWIKIVRRAKGLGLTVSLDTNWDPAEAWDIDLEEALTSVDVLLPNEQEAKQLCGVASLAEAAQYLRQAVPVLVVKRGVEGASAWTKGIETVGTVAEADAGGDGIGAGDSFDAGFLFGWLNGLAMPDCLSIACRCGRAVAGQVGGVKGQPRPADLREPLMLKSDPGKRQ